MAHASWQPPRPLRGCWRPPHARASWAHLRRDRATGRRGISGPRGRRGTTQTAMRRLRRSAGRAPAPASARRRAGRGASESAAPWRTPRSAPSAVAARHSAGTRARRPRTFGASVGPRRATGRRARRHTGCGGSTGRIARRAVRHHLFAPRHSRSQHAVIRPQAAERVVCQRAGASAQNSPAPPAFDVDPRGPTLPAQWTLGQVTGVAVDASVQRRECRAGGLEATADGEGSLRGAVRAGSTTTPSRTRYARSRWVAATGYSWATVKLASARPTS